MKKHFTSFFIFTLLFFFNPYIYADNEASFKLEELKYNIIYPNEVECEYGAFYHSEYAPIVINIPDTVLYNGKKFAVTRIAKQAFKYFRKTKSIILPATIRSIGKEAFMECNSLQSIYLPEKLHSIGDRAFYSSGIQDTIHISSYTTYLGDEVFSYCINLKHISVENNNRNYTSENGMLFNKNKTILHTCPTEKIGNFQLPVTLTQINPRAFAGCRDLKEITIPQGVLSIGEDAFRGCINLREITIPESVKSIGQCAFYNCKSLRNITLPEFIVKIDSATFAHCTNLTEVNLPEGLKSIEEEAFSNCKSLKKIILPKSIEYIGKGIFYRSYNLKEITVNWDNPKKTQILGIFSIRDTGHIILSIPKGKKRKYMRHAIWRNLDIRER